jgi:hypothetical protein
MVFGLLWDMTLSHSLSKYQKFLPLTVFLFFFIFTLFIRLQSFSLSSADDPYYHAMRSASIWSNETILMPAFSTLSDKPVNLYALYHVTMAPFTFLFHGDNYQALIIGDKIYHSLINGLLFLTFYLVISRCLFLINSRLSKITTALIGTILLFAVSHIFSFRILLERPHTISIIFMLIVFACLVRQRYTWLFLSIFLFPFFYSASFLILIPPGIYFLASLFYHGKQSFLVSIKPLLISFAALAVGIATRPDSLQYLYNGYLVHILTIYRTIFTDTPGQPAELGNALGNIAHEYWVALFVICFLTTLYILFTRGKRVVSFTTWFLFCLASSFVIGFFVVERTIEYAFPFALLYVLTTITLYIPILKQDIYEVTAIHHKFQDLLRVLYRMFIDHAKKFRILAFLFMALIFVAQTTSMIRTERKAPSYLMYKGASEYLQTHVIPGSIIYTPRFGMFTGLFFFNPTLQYTSGLDPTFTYMHDETLYYKMLHLNSGELICGEPTCSQGEDAYAFLQDTIKTQFVFIDTRYFLQNKNKPTFQKLLENDPRFTKVFEDATFPNVRVYSLK